MDVSSFALSEFLQVSVRNRCVRFGATRRLAELC